MIIISAKDCTAVANLPYYLQAVVAVVVELVVASASAVEAKRFETVPVEHLETSSQLRRERN